jgi:transcriptional regulator with XRE-family HTH domain
MAIDECYIEVMEADELRARRDALGMSRDELARELCVTAVTIWRWETGGRKIPPYLSLALETIERKHKEKDNKRA